MLGEELTQVKSQQGTKHRRKGALIGICAEGYWSSLGITTSGESSDTDGSRMRQKYLKIPRKTDQLAGCSGICL